MNRDLVRIEESLQNRNEECPRFPLSSNFPSLIHTTFGGGPKRKPLWLKSVSLETIVKPNCFAYSHTSISTAEANPKSRSVQNRGTHQRSCVPAYKTGSDRRVISSGGSKQFALA